MSLPFILKRQLADLGVQCLDVRAAFALFSGSREYLGSTL
jgi:hypothetical protein